MKDRLVIDAERDQGEKVLLALQLQEGEEQVKIYVFPEAVATESFEKELMDKWRKGEEVDFPEGYSEMERPLTMSDPILPASFTLNDDNAELVKRAQTEWHFKMLSHKLSQEFQKELDELREKIESLDSYSKDYWDALKTFWDKVQTQVREKTLQWQHTKPLKEVTNSLFTKLKTLRKQFDEQLRERSAVYKEELTKALEDIEQKINNDARLKPLFDELRELQSTFWNKELIRKHRAELKAYFDKLFQEIKQKRYGSTEGSPHDPVARLERRMSGLLKAIEKMENSIARDEKELAFQQERSDSSDGQLAAQLRQAKIMMIQERIQSKRKKLEDMYKTREEVKAKLAAAKARKERMEEEKRRREELARAQEVIKEKISSEIKEKNLTEEERLKLEKAAKELAEAKQKTDKPSEPPASDASSKELVQKAAEIGEVVADKIENVVEDILDSVKAVAEVLDDKLDDLLRDRKTGDG